MIKMNKNVEKYYKQILLMVDKNEHHDKGKFAK